MDADEYFRHRSFSGYALGRFLHGDLGRTVISVWKRIRKYTLISGIIKAVAITLTLLEKSALLLLVATGLLITLPIAATLFIIYGTACFIKFLTVSAEIGEWLGAGKLVTVFITKERVFSNDKQKLFVRDACEIAASKKNPVIIVCTDTVLASKWYSLNVLAVRAEIFFILRRKFLDKIASKTTFIVL